MPCVTYFSEQSTEPWRRMLEQANPELGKLLDEVNEKGGRYKLQPVHATSKKHWYSKAKPLVLYYLFWQLDDTEWQIINFPGGETSINELVESPLITTLFYGYLGGHQQKDGAK